MKPSASPWFAVIILAAVNLINYMDRTVLSVLLPAIKSDLDLSDVQLGILTGLAFALVYAAFGIPLAIWADRSSRRNIIAVVVALWSVMTMLTGLATTFVQLALARVGVGVCESGCIPSSHSMISDIVLPDRRAGALGLFSAGGSMGAILGLGLGGVLQVPWGWRWTLVAFGVPGLILAVLVRLMLTEPPRRTPAASPPSIGLTFRTLSARPLYRHTVMVIASASLVSAALISWTPSFLTRSFELTSAQAGPMFALAYGVGSAIGTLGGGFLMDYVGRSAAHRHARIMRFAAACYAVAMIFGVLAYSSTSPTSSVVFLSAFMIVASMPNGGLFALLHGTVPEQMRAAAVAVAMFVASALGLGFGPVIVGLVSDGLFAWLGTESLRYALTVAVLFLIWPIGQLLWVSTFVGDRADLKSLLQSRD